MYYFGTDLTSAGHFIWDMDGERMQWSKITYRSLPFDLEDYMDNKDGFRPGYLKFDNVEGYSILGISGSCSDNRVGTKSIFFIKETMDFDAMLEKIKSIPIAMKILNQLRKKIKEHWQKGDEYTTAIDRFFPDGTPFIL